MTDRLTVRMVVTFLGLATLVGMLGLIWLVGTTTVKDASLLAAVAGPTGTALGALATLLASTRTEQAAPPAQQLPPTATMPVTAAPLEPPTH